MQQSPSGLWGGMSGFTTELGPKRFGLLREVMPNSGLIAFLVNPNSVGSRRTKSAANSGRRSSRAADNEARFLQRREDRRVYFFSIG